ncbi:hypothetical protein M8C21_006053 [Ambrosia artemisiifolia]|uniref:F-box/FBD/LRR-repeat protein n=1 Tax=Ambrosia artemisiifolia TaxID=4212 RepID=A0AAD5D777_AMBAR|nr:hypothetical protein M8C21_006053 [Ambrosia artemisiifolia]
MALEASEFTPEDFISKMPDNVITSILHRLPLLDAVRTGILSRTWRFKWTMLTQLKFNEEFFLYLMKTKGVDSIGRIISRLLLNLNGAVTKTVFVPVILDVDDIRRLIMFLSSKGIKDLTITDWSAPQVKLPTHLFACLELTRLNIYGFCFNPPPGFHGFPNLVSLELRGGQFEGDDLGEFLTRVRLSFVFELTEDGATKKFPTAFTSIRALKLTRIDFGNRLMLSFALETIGHFLNLQTLDIISSSRHVDDPFPISIPEVDYNMTELRSVMFRCFKGSENEVYMIKYLLACSPSLKAIGILRDRCLQPVEELIYAKKLLKLHRASAEAEIDFY